MKAGRAGDLDRAQRDAKDQITRSLLPRAYIPAITALACSAIRPNRVFDRTRTEAAQEAERSLVAPQIAQIFAGDIVVRQGELVTAGTIDKLRALGLQNPRLEPAVVVSIGLLVALMLAMVAVYTARYHAAIHKSTKLLMLLSLLASNFYHAQQSRRLLQSYHLTK